MNGFGARLAAAASRRLRDRRSRAARPRRLNGVVFLILLIPVCITFAQLRDEAPPPVVRFTNVDVMVDSHDTPMAAYQVEFVADPNRVTLVGIEGGEHPAFKQPPYYDPKALRGNRVILAALNTGQNLPSHKTRVARLHLRVLGDELPKFSAKLVVAAASNDKTIAADVSVIQGVSP